MNRRQVLWHAAVAIARYLHCQEVDVEERQSTKCALIFTWRDRTDREFGWQLTFDDLDELGETEQYDSAPIVLHLAGQHEKLNNRYRFSVFKGKEGELWFRDYNGDFLVPDQSPKPTGDAGRDPSPR